MCIKPNYKYLMKYIGVHLHIIYEWGTSLGMLKFYLKKRDKRNEWHCTNTYERKLRECKFSPNNKIYLICLIAVWKNCCGATYVCSCAYHNVKTINGVEEFTRFGLFPCLRTSILNSFR